LFVIGRRLLLVPIFPDDDDERNDDDADERFNRRGSLIHRNELGKVDKAVGNVSKSYHGSKKLS
jgi:hypothetical protein